MTINLHLSGWNTILQSSAHLVRASRSLCMVWRSNGFLISPMSSLSSAKSFRMWCTTCGMSFMNMTNSSGPSTLPCGAPLVTSSQLDELKPITTRCRRLRRKSLIQFVMRSSNPHVTSLASNEMWHTLSKAFAKSKNIMRASVLAFEAKK